MKAGRRDPLLEERRDGSGDRPLKGRASPKTVLLADRWTQSQGYRVDVRLPRGTSEASLHAATVRLRTTSPSPSWRRWRVRSSTTRSRTVSWRRRARARAVPGARPRLDADLRAALKALVEQGPVPAAHGVVRWRLVDLAQILFEDHGVSVSEQTLSRVLRSMGYRKLSARPRHHAQDPDAIPAFKKPSRLAWRRSRRLPEASR